MKANKHLKHAMGEVYEDCKICVQEVSHKFLKLKNNIIYKLGHFCEVPTYTYV